MVPYPSNGTLPRPWLSRLGSPKPIIPIRNTWLLKGYRQIGIDSYVLLTIFRGMAALVAHRFNLIISASYQRPQKAGKDRIEMTKMPRPHRYFVITLTLAAIAAGRCALAASDAQTGLVRSTFADVD